MTTLLSLRRRILLCGAALMVFGPSAVAAEVAAQDAAQVRAIVQAQLEAFSNGDAAKAFSLAAPGIQQMFGNAEWCSARPRRPSCGLKPKATW
jgi:hypothetical protein